MKKILLTITLVLGFSATASADSWVNLVSWTVGSSSDRVDVSVPASFVLNSTCEHRLVTSRSNVTEIYSQVDFSSGNLPLNGLVTPSSNVSAFLNFQRPVVSCRAGSVNDCQIEKYEVGIYAPFSSGGSANAQINFFPKLNQGYVTRPRPTLVRLLERCVSGGAAVVTN